jgi:hypothetical protein
LKIKATQPEDVLAPEGGLEGVAGLSLEGIGGLLGQTAKYRLLHIIKKQRPCWGSIFSLMSYLVIKK